MTAKRNTIKETGDFILKGQQSFNQPGLARFVNWIRPLIQVDTPYLQRMGENGRRVRPDHFLSARAIALASFAIFAAIAAAFVALAVAAAASADACSAASSA